MPYRFVLALMFVAATALAQGRGRNAPPAGPPHDPQDLSGIWLGRAAGALTIRSLHSPLPAKPRSTQTSRRSARAPFRRPSAMIHSEERTRRVFRAL